MMIPDIERARKYARGEFQMGVPEGLARHGDSTRMYYDGRSYKVKIVFVVEEECE